MGREPRFREVQLFVLSPVALIALLIVAVVVAVDLAAGAGLSWVDGIILFLGAFVIIAGRLTTEVTDDEIRLTFFPFARRRIPLVDVYASEACTYHPILEYGGWGIRFRFGSSAYNVSGNEGVRLALANGRTFMIGSRRNKELAAAIDAAKDDADEIVESG